MEQRLILVNLLLKLGVAAAVSSALVRSLEFKKLLFREERTTAQKIYLVLWFGIPIALGVWIRFIQKSFSAGDLSFETTLLLGVIGGRLTGVLGGSLIALPALLHGEWATLRFMHGELAHYFPWTTFTMESPNRWVEAAIYATSIMVIGTELKIFGGVRIQIKLEEQERLLLQARMEALQNQ